MTRDTNPSQLLANERNVRITHVQVKVNISSEAILSYFNEGKRKILDSDTSFVRGLDRNP